VCKIFKLRKGKMEKIENVLLFQSHRFLIYGSVIF